MARVATISACLAVLLCSPVAASDFYEWTDEQGVTHYTDSLAEVPEKYRAQVKAPRPEPRRTPPAVGETSPVQTGEIAPPEADVPGLARFEVPYENEGDTDRIILSVTFNDSVTAPMALDTGSPGLVISVDLAERLRVFSRDSGTLLVQTAGIGGSALAVRTILDSVSVESARNVFVPTTVTASLSTDFEGLVGMDFLANYTVSIDASRRLVLFQENAPDPELRAGRSEEWWRKTFRQFRDSRDGWEGWKKRASERGRIHANTLRVVDFQIREAEQLLMRLEGYASDNAVPRHWR